MHTPPTALVQFYRVRVYTRLRNPHCNTNSGVLERGPFAINDIQADFYWICFSRRNDKLRARPINVPETIVRAIPRPKTNEIARFATRDGRRRERVCPYIIY